MSDKIEKKKSKRKKRHSKQYYYYIPDDLPSDDDCTTDYYSPAAATPCLSKERGLLLYEKASAVQQRLESILIDETKQKMKCVQEIGRINGHLIAENQHVSGVNVRKVISRNSQ